MFEFEANEAVIVEQKKILEQALTTNPKTEKLLRKLIREQIMRAREDVVHGIKFKNGDPRGSAQAVRTSVYKKIFGANINIFQSKKAHGFNNYTPPRKGVSGRGGNRRQRHSLDRGKYDPLDRGFILRWMNEGTVQRHISFTENERRKVDKWNHHPNTGFRGSISARNFFRPLGDAALGRMRDNLAIVIESELANIMNQK